MAISVNDPGRFYQGDPFGIMSETAVDVPVNEVLRAPSTNQPAKDDKALMAGILGIMHKTRRGVGHDDVNAAPPQERGQHPKYQESHLPFGVLVRPAVIPVRAPKSQNVNAPETHQPAVNLGASKERLSVIADIVVAADVIEGHVKKVSQKRQILRRQIAARQDEIDSCKPAGIDCGIQRWLDNI
jgi:hypothetical protein